MAKVEIEITPITLSFSEETQGELTTRALELLRAQTRAGIDGDGNRIEGKKGQKLDLTETGNLLNNARVKKDEIEFLAPYAEHVLPKYKADRLSPAVLEKLERDIQKTLDDGIEQKESEA